MKPQRFYPGQEVVCVDDGFEPDENYRASNEDYPNPLQHKVYKVEKYCGRYCMIPGPSYKEPYLHIVGFVPCYSQDALKIMPHGWLNEFRLSL